MKQWGMRTAPNRTMSPWGGFSNCLGQFLNPFLSNPQGYLYILFPTQKYKNISYQNLIFTQNHRGKGRIPKWGDRWVRPALQRVQRNPYSIPFQRYVTNNSSVLYIYIYRERRWLYICQSFIRFNQKRVEGWILTRSRAGVVLATFP